jgi:hypothetical protein
MSGRQSMEEALGYTWDQSAIPRDIPSFSVERAMWRFQRTLPEYVWDAAALEGNPFTYPEVQTLLDGITVGGRKISDEQQVLNLAEAANELLQLVKTGEFRLAKEVSDRLQYLIARDEARSPDTLEVRERSSLRQAWDSVRAAATCHREPSQAARISAGSMPAAYNSLRLNWTIPSSKPLRTSCSPPFNSSISTRTSALPVT